MTSHVVRLGAVGYLNARPLVYGLEHSRRFALRFDVPALCADLLHAGGIDLGLIPSIEYLRGRDYRIVPDLAITSRGAVRSVALYTKKPMADVRSIAMDTSSRTSVALVGVLCARAFKIQPILQPASPDLSSMLTDCDAALVIGDNALFLEGGALSPDSLGPAPDATAGSNVEKIDLGEVWTNLTGLPFVYAFWAGPAGVLTSDHVAELQSARDEAVRRPEDVAREYFAGAPAQQAVGAAYLRDNIKYYLGLDERAGLSLFYRYAAEAGVVGSVQDLRFF